MRCLRDSEPRVTKFIYSLSVERFERPIKDAFKISIHKSYRENGLAKKKQWVICTIGYYNIIGPFAEEIIGGSIERKIEELEVPYGHIWDLIQEKPQPLKNVIKDKFENTEEYKTCKNNEEIIKIYNEAKKEFENKYGNDTYDYCYDVFGVLRNEEYLKQLETAYKARQQYTGSGSYYGNSYSYYDTNSSNYSYEDFSSYFKPKSST